MTVQPRNKPKKFYNLSRLPMDMARLVCAPLLLLFRMKRLTPTGEIYRGRIRGGAVLAANHTSFADPFLVGCAVWYRRMFFLAAEVVMKGKLRSLLLKGVGAIKIDRNKADINAIRKSVDILKQGYLLTIFPQGGISAQADIHTLKSGAVLIALQAGVPIVPMHIEPKKKWYSRRIAIIGNAIDPQEYIQKKIPSTTDIDRITKVLLAEMNRCINHA